MEPVFRFLAANPPVLLLLVVGMAVWMGRVNIRGYGLGMVASAIIAGTAVATYASVYGVTLRLDDVTRSLFYCLFMYGVGLRIGPSFINCLRGDGIRFAFLAVLCSVLGLTGAVFLARLFELPPGAAGGILAGSMTMSAAIGSAEQAVASGMYVPPPGVTPDQVRSMIALSYGVTSIWGTVGLILICRYLPRWWGVDARAAARQYEDQFGVTNMDESGLTGYRPAGLRAYRVTNPETAGKTVAQFRLAYPMYRVINVVRGASALAPDPDVVLERDSVVALGGRIEDLTDRMGVVGPEVTDQRALNVPLDQAEILVTNKAIEGKALKEFRGSEFAGQVQLLRMERSGAPVPLGLETTLQRMDVLHVVGLRDAVNKAATLIGRIARPSAATDLLTLAVGMIMGFLLGSVTIEVRGSAIGLGNAGGLLLSGIAVSSLASRLRFFGSTPTAARNVLEELGLIVFIAIVGVNAGATLLAQLTGPVALDIFIAGFIVCTVPPIVAWAVGYHILKINAAVLMGGVAGARSHAGPAREAAADVDSSIPWIGFPVGYAVSGVLLTLFGYVAMVLS